VIPPLRLLTAFLLAMPLAACATARPPELSLAGGYCAVARLIRPSRADTPGTLRQILAHNEKVRALCRRGAHGKEKR
jgi:hypothetical protein